MEDQRASEYHQLEHRVRYKLVVGLHVMVVQLERPHRGQVGRHPLYCPLYILHSRGELGDRVAEEQWEVMRW